MFHELNELCLEITNRCLMNCMHCSGNSSIDPEACLDSRIVTEVVDDFMQLGGKLLEISGGEPLIHDELSSVLSHAKSHGLEVRLYTSGTTRTSGLTLYEARRLKQAGADKVIFSLEGATAKTHDTITRSPGSFDRAVAGMLNAKSAGIWTGVHFVPMKLNVDELEALVRLCISLKLDELGILRFVPQGNGRIHRVRLELSRDEFAGLILKIVGLRERYDELSIRTGCPLNFTSIISRGPVEACKVGASTCVVKPNGDVVPCPAFKQDAGRIMGNVLRERLVKIWNDDEAWAEFRKFDRSLLKEPCHSCKKIALCAGRCAAQRILNYGDIKSAPDPMCPLVRQDPARGLLVHA